MIRKTVWKDAKTLRPTLGRSVANVILLLWAHFKLVLHFSASKYSRLFIVMKLVALYFVVWLLPRTFILKRTHEITDKCHCAFGSLRFWFPCFHSFIHARKPLSKVREHLARHTIIWWHSYGDILTSKTCNFKALYDCAFRKIWDSKTMS